MGLQASEIARMKESHTTENASLKAELQGLKDEIVSMNRTNKTMAEDLSLKWRALREENSSLKYESEKLEAREYKAQSELRLATEDMETARERSANAIEEISELETLNRKAVEDTIQARRELQERVEYANEARMSRCTEIQADRMEGETRLRMELQSTQQASHRLQQEKVEVSARLALADNEAAAVMQELVREQAANHDLRAANASLATKLRGEQEEAIKLRGELTMAADDVINVQNELNTVLKVQQALRLENRELGHLNVKAVDYRQYMAPFDLHQMDTKEAWAEHNQVVLGRPGMQSLISKYQGIKSEVGTRNMAGLE
jgi:chromosome segregation ATPase